MKINNIAIGVALALSVVALVLALWPVVADAPWELDQQALIRYTVEDRAEPSQREVCMVLLDAIARASVSGAGMLFLGVGNQAGPWRLAGCSEYFSQFAK